MSFLPWLPAKRNKRFPVAKRSPKESSPMKDSIAKIPTTLTETKETIEIKKRSSDVKKVNDADAVKSKPLMSEVLGEKKESVHVPKKRDTEAVLKDEKMKKKT